LLRCSHYESWASCCHVLNPGERVALQYLGWVSCYGTRIAKAGPLVCMHSPTAPPLLHRVLVAVYGVNCNTIFSTGYCSLRPISTCAMYMYLAYRILTFIINYALYRSGRLCNLILKFVYRTLNYHPLKSLTSPILTLKAHR